MGFTKEIFNRASITAITDFLLYGSPVDGVVKDSETRMNEAYHKFDKRVLHYVQEDHEKLMDYANELVSEATDVYTGIGLQAGILIMMDIVKNTKFIERKLGDTAQNVDYREMYNSLFSEVSLALKYFQKNDEKSMEKAEMILKAAQCRTEDMYITAK